MAYPHDEFDDVPEDSTRRGAYRGVEIDPTKSTKKTLAVVIAGVLALLVGGIMFVVSPRLSSPEASGSAAPGSSTSASASADSSVSSAAADQTKTGMVYNSGAFQGAAGQASTLLGNNQYTIAQVTNWQGAPVYNSTVFYSEGNADEAEAVAKLIGVPYIQQDSSTDLEFYVVLAADYAGLPTAGEESTEIINLTSTNGEVNSGDATAQTGADAGAPAGPDNGG